MSEPNKPLDPETMSLEELRTLANAEPEAKPDPDPEVKPEKPETKNVADPEEEPEEKILYQRRIDLGDGSGVQVFQAESMEELIDKLVTAQENATKKIRELNAALPKPTSKPKERTADDEFVLSQEFMTKPSKAFEKLFQDTVGMPIGEFKTKLERVTAFEQAQAANQAANDFVAATPEYLANPANGQRMKNYLQTYQLPATVENMQKAFRELTASGLLEVKPVKTEVTDPEVKPDEKPQVTVVQHTRSTPKRTASGLSTRGNSTPAKPTTSGPTEKELYEMPLEQLRDLANKRDPQDF